MSPDWHKRQLTKTFRSLDRYIEDQKAADKAEAARRRAEAGRMPRPRKSDQPK